MALRWAFPGGNFLASVSSLVVPGISTAGGGSVQSNAPTGAGDTFAIGVNNASLRTINLGSFTTMYAGYRLYIGAFTSTTLIQFFDSLGAVQCDLRVSVAGTLFFTRAGTQIGGISTVALPLNAWTYIEFKATMSSTVGVCEARINGVVVLTATGINNSTTGNAGSAQFIGPNSATYFKDMYIVDAGTGANQSYLGDIRVYETFDTGAGINSKWVAATNVGPFVLTSVANGGGSLAIYNGAITGGGSNAYVNYYFNSGGFSNANNNQIAAKCASSNAAALVLSVSGAITPETITSFAVSATTFTLSAVNATSNVFTGTIMSGGTPANVYTGYNFNVTGFGNAANNVVGAQCTASTNTSFTIIASSAVGLVTETHAAIATIQNPVQIGINQTGTRPNGDGVYVYDSVAGEIIDYTHQQLTGIVGNILGVCHYSYVRKDDVGTKIFVQWTNSAGTIESSSNVSPGNTYQYWLDILENDPNTSTQFTLAGFNATNFGVKVIS